MNASEIDNLKKGDRLIAYAGTKDEAIGSVVADAHKMVVHIKWDDGRESYLSPRNNFAHIEKYWP